MNAEEIRIKVAECLGWKLVPFDGKGRWLRNGVCTILYPPDFTNSLDACADMEQTLTDDEIPMYMDELFHVANGTRNFVGFRHKAVMATAAQRCEAYLKVKGLWTP